MAAILKIPRGDEKGVLSITTPERDRILYKDPAGPPALEALKNRWVVGLHHNWHDWEFNYNPLFDFSMAGEGDLIETQDKPFYRLPMDACNFVPEDFAPNYEMKFWDVLYVARAVFFKKIPEMFNCIRELYDRGKMYRVLLICPIPPYEKSQERTVFYKVREVYDEMFSDAEKNLFTLMTIKYRYPFPFDLPTLAHFYRSSRVFAHFADQERRCRVASYAWAAGLPVVGLECVTSLLTPELKKEPGYYQANDYSDFTDALIRAVETARDNPTPLPEYEKLFAVRFTKDSYAGELEKYFQAHDLKFSREGLAFQDLDIRLGRHHGFGGFNNSVAMPLLELLQYLRETSDEDLKQWIERDDPETALRESLYPGDAYAPAGPPPARRSLFSRLLGRA